MRFSKLAKRFFSSQTAKKTKMELTIRTPYSTILENFSDFKRIVAKTSDGVLNIQNRTPAQLVVLPPGILKVKMEKEVPNFSGDIFHLGGFIAVNPDNTCQMHLVEVVDRKMIKLDHVSKGSLEQVEGGVAARYVDKIRSYSTKSVLKQVK